MDLLLLELLSESSELALPLDPLVPCPEVVEPPEAPAPDDPLGDDPAFDPPPAELRLLRHSLNSSENLR